MNIWALLHITPWKNILQKKPIYGFFCTNNYSTIIYYLIQPRLHTSYLSELVCITQIIWVSISAYIDIGTAKVPISGKNGAVSKDIPPKYGNRQEFRYSVIYQK